jgi:CASC3/Barentsz eIF4AIII binding protein
MQLPKERVFLLMAMMTPADLIVKVWNMGLGCAKGGASQPACVRVLWTALVLLYPHLLPRLLQLGRLHTDGDESDVSSASDIESGGEGESESESDSGSSVGSRYAALPLHAVGGVGTTMPATTTTIVITTSPTVSPCGLSGSGGSEGEAEEERRDPKLVPKTGKYYMHDSRRSEVCSTHTPPPPNTCEM